MAPTQSAADAERGIDRIELTRMFLSATEPTDVLDVVARVVCERTGFRRSVILDIDSVQGVVRGRSGHGVDPARVAAAGGPVGDYRIITESAAERPLLIPAREVGTLVPQHCLDLFDVHGPIVAQQLRSDRLGLLGVLFCDGGARSTFQAGPEDLATLAELSEVATLAFQQALLLRRSVSLQELRERSRIAAALHDGVTQQLFAATLEIAELRAVADLHGGAEAVVDRMADRLGTALRQLRAALVEIASGGVPDDRESQRLGEPVVDRLRGLLGAISAASGPLPDLDVSGEGPEPDLAQADLLVRAVREGVANAGHHGRATQVAVHLRRGGSWWVVEIDDDGTGDVAAVKRILRSLPGRSFGLPSLAKECARVGGRIWVSRAPLLCGLRLGVAVPLTTG